MSKKATGAFGSRKRTNKSNISSNKACKKVIQIGCYFQADDGIGFEFLFGTKDNLHSSPIPLIPVTDNSRKLKEFADLMLDATQLIVDDFKQDGFTLSEALDFIYDQTYTYAKYNCQTDHNHNIEDLIIMYSNVIILETFGRIKTDNHNGIMYWADSEAYRPKAIVW